VVSRRRFDKEAKMELGLVGDLQTKMGYAEIT
jgi:hypothetical protein